MKYKAHGCNGFNRVWDVAVELNEWLFEVLMCKLGYEHKFLLHFDMYFHSF